MMATSSSFDLVHGDSGDCPSASMTSTLGARPPRRPMQRGWWHSYSSCGKSGAYLGLVDAAGVPKDDANEVPKLLYILRDCFCSNCQPSNQTMESLPPKHPTKYVDFKPSSLHGYVECYLVKI